MPDVGEVGVLPRPEFNCAVACGLPRCLLPSWRTACWPAGFSVHARERTSSVPAAKVGWMARLPLLSVMSQM